VRIKRGFRHQIRCHLCWIGYPIQNDSLYSQPEKVGEIIPSLEPPENKLSACKLALRSHALFFTDPASGEHKEYRISPLS